MFTVNRITAIIVSFTILVLFALILGAKGFFISIIFEIFGIIIIWFPERAGKISKSMHFLGGRHVTNPDDDPLSGFYKETPPLLAILSGWCFLLIPLIILISIYLQKP
jgi:hypothetical protein